MSDRRRRLIYALLVLALLAPLLTTGAAGAQVQVQDPTPAPTPAAWDWARLDRAITRQAAVGNLLVAEVRDDACVPLHGWRPEARLAVASTFKLYVLAELARQVEAGQLRWDERLPIQDAYRSMPSGDLAFAPAGTLRTVEAFATAMIGDSDNTATDHLIARLGRRNVEAAFARAGHGAPELNMPLLLTRELFAIKMRQPDHWMDAYLNADDAAQRAMLERDIFPQRLDPYGDWGNWHGPVRIDGIEWFASASELCTVLAGLHAQSARPGLEPLRDILFSSDGRVARDPAWRAIGFKGGRESGVLNLTWLVERTDGRVFVVTAGLNDPVRELTSRATRRALEPVWACLARADVCDVRG